MAFVSGTTLHTWYTWHMAHTCSKVSMTYITHAADICMRSHCDLTLSSDLPSREDVVILQSIWYKSNMSKQHSN